MEVFIVSLDAMNTSKQIESLKELELEQHWPLLQVFIVSLDAMNTSKRSP